MTDTSKTIEFEHQPTSESEVASEATRTKGASNLLGALNKVPPNKQIEFLEEAFKK